MILQKTYLPYILFAIAIIFSCNSSVEQSAKEEIPQIAKSQKSTTSIFPNGKKEIKKDTIIYHNFRPNQPLYLDEFYTDTLEVVGKNDDTDYFSFIFQKDDSTYHFNYYSDPDEEEKYDFARGDIVALTWNIDTLYIAGEDDSIAHDLWIVNTKILSSNSLELSDTLSVLTDVLGKEFLNYYIIDWTAGDLNDDEIEDFVVVLESDFTDKEITSDENTRIRKTVLLETIDFPKIKISATNDAIVDCSMCSGAGNRDPYRKVVIENNHFHFESNYGGSQSDYFTVTFKYAAKKRNWFLHEIRVSSHNHLEEEAIPERIKKDFGEITFADYTDIKDDQ